MVKKQYVFLQLIFSGDYCVVELEDGDGLNTPHRKSAYGHFGTVSFYNGG